MINSLLNFPTRLLLAISITMLGGCVGPLDLIIQGVAESQMTPEGLGISAAQYRHYSCVDLADLRTRFTQAMAADQEKRSWQWNIDAMNQVRTEKNCDTKASFPNPQTLTDIKPMIGVQIAEMTPLVAKKIGADATKGVLVVKTENGMPAEKAGIKPNDVIIEFSGQNISSQKEFVDAVSRMRIGYKAEILIWRNGSQKKLIVEIGSSAKITAPTGKINAPSNATVEHQATTGPIVYSYCFYTDFANRRHWTSSVFDIVSTPSVEQTVPMGQEFYKFIGERNNITVNDYAYCGIYDTRRQAESEWNKTRTLYRFDTVQNNEVVWKPSNPKPRIWSEAEMEQELWNSIKDANNADAFGGYLKQYPKGQYIEIAKNKIAAFKAEGRENPLTKSLTNGRNLLDDELDIWNTARGLDTISAYQIYIKNFPNGRHVKYAQAAIEKINKTQEKNKPPVENTPANIVKRSDIRSISLTVSDSVDNIKFGKGACQFVRKHSPFIREVIEQQLRQDFPEATINYGGGGDLSIEVEVAQITFEGWGKDITLGMIMNSKITANGFPPIKKTESASSLNHYSWGLSCSVWDNDVTSEHQKVLALLSKKVANNVSSRF